jgi:hypothetical protein
MTHIIRPLAKRTFARGGKRLKRKGKITNLSPFSRQMPRSLFNISTSVIEEPDEAKVSCPVLKTSGSREGIA